MHTHTPTLPRSLSRVPNHPNATQNTTGAHYKDQVLFYLCSSSNKNSNNGEARVQNHRQQKQYNVIINIKQANNNNNNNKRKKKSTTIHPTDTSKTSFEMAMEELRRTGGKKAQIEPTIIHLPCDLMQWCLR